jgi:anti-sigma regulatory factor (Ser/Thr protein kinase)
MAQTTATPVSTTCQGDRTMILTAEPQAVGRGRKFVRKALTQWKVCDGAIADAVVVTSELVTNALNHTPGQKLLLKVVKVSGVIAISVWDPSDKEPEERQADEDDENGRGIPVIRSLSKDWGWNLDPHGGKIVWAVIGK